MIQKINNSIYKISNDSDVRCEIFKPDSDFPADLFTLSQRQSGFIIFHFLAVIYTVITAEHICDNYFMPSLEYISFEKLKLSPHVAGATLLAFASSISELLTSTVGVFFAKNDISMNTLIGSGAYNLLVIISLCCFCVYKLNAQLIKYPILRDCFFYMLSSVSLYFLLYKNDFIRLYYYDDLIIIFIFVLYLLVNIFDTRINHLIKCLMDREFFKKPVIYKPTSKEAVDHVEIGLGTTDIDLDTIKKHSRRKMSDDYLNDDDSASLSTNSSQDYEEPYSLFKSYKDYKHLSLFKKIWLTIIFPVRLLTYVAILDFRRFNKLKDLVLLVTFLSSLFFIGCCSFLLIWMVVVICETFNISETIAGFTFLAAATSIEETLTSISLCKRELKRAAEKKDNLNRLNMALSNCIGSNVFDLCVGIGVPYFLNSVIVSRKYFTNVYHQNISFTVFGLVFCVILFLGLLVIFKWKLTKNFGISLLIIWVAYVVLVILNYLNLIEISLFKYGTTKCVLI